MDNDAYYIIFNYNDDVQLRLLNKTIHNIYNKICLSTNILESISDLSKLQSIRTGLEPQYNQIKEQYDQTELDVITSKLKLKIFKNYTNNTTRKDIIDAINGIELLSHDDPDECENCYIKVKNIRYKLMDDNLNICFNSSENNDSTGSINSKYV